MLMVEVISVTTKRSRVSPHLLWWKIALGKYLSIIELPQANACFNFKGKTNFFLAVHRRNGNPRLIELHAIWNTFVNGQFHRNFSNKIQMKFTAMSAKEITIYSSNIWGPFSMISFEQVLWNSQCRLIKKWSWNCVLSQQKHYNLNFDWLLRLRKVKVVVSAGFQQSFTFVKSFTFFLTKSVLCLSRWQKLSSKH